MKTPRGTQKFPATSARPGRRGSARGGPAPARAVAPAASAGPVIAPGEQGAAAIVEAVVSAVPTTVPARVPHSARKLARMIFTRNDPVDVATKLLNGELDSTAAKIYAMLLEYLYGKPAPRLEAGNPEGGKTLYEFVTYAPRPQHQLEAGPPACPPSRRASGALGPETVSSTEVPHGRHE